MKNLPALFLFFLLVSCTLAVTEVTAPTETSVPTNTPAPTATIIPSPTPTATPVAIDGVADVDGVRYVFDDKKQEWVALTELPADAGDLAVKVDDEGKVVAVDEKGAVAYEYNLSANKWEKVEKVYTSGADPELQAKVIAEAEAHFGMSIQEKMDLMERQWNSFTSKEKGVYRSLQMYLGNEVVSISSVGGALPTDRALIVYGVEQGNTDFAVPYVAGYEYKGEYYRIMNYSVDGGSGIQDWPETFDDHKGLLDSRLKIGGVVRIEIQTFGSHDKTPEQWLALKFEPQQSNLGFSTEAILKLIELMNNEFMERMTGVTIKQVNEQLDVSLGDFGLFAPGLMNQVND